MTVPWEEMNVVWSIEGKKVGHMTYHLTKSIKIDTSTKSHFFLTFYGIQVSI